VELSGVLFRGDIQRRTCPLEKTPLNPGTRPLCLPGRPRGASGAGYFVGSATNTGITRVVFAWYSSYGGNAATASFQSRARSAAS